MKHYGSKVWGWEMPWWGRDVGDPTENARKHGADFGRAFFAVQQIIGDPSVGEAAPLPPETIPAGRPHEILVNGKRHVRNPAREAAVIGELKSPSGKKSQIEGTYEGDQGWRLRFTPDETGDWSYLLRGEGVEVYATGRWTCVQSP
jgi:hypothetical protein